MRRSYWLVGALFAWLVLVGMGNPPGHVSPSPDISFNATVIDDQDIATKLTQATWDGDIFFSGMRGKGSITISFEKVKKATAVGSAVPNTMDFQIMLKSGDVVAVTFDSDVRFRGATSFGTYRILAKNIKEITFE